MAVVVKIRKYPKYKKQSFCYHHCDMKQINDFIQTGIWRIRVKGLSKRKSVLIQTLRIAILSFRNFQKNQCILRASALTFYSLLSIVPVVAMAFGIAKGFGLDKRLEAEILTSMKSYEEVAQQVIGFSRAMLDNTKGGLVAGIGVILLFTSIIKLLGNIELAFNDIWGVKVGRNFGRKFSDYMSLMLICPLLWITSSSVSIFLISQVTAITEQIKILGFLSPLILGALRLIPVVVIGGLFSFMYSYMPNTKVKLTSALVAGAIAGVIYQVLQWGYIHFQVGAANYGAIYGSFAALPLFLMWLQLSWFVVLFGAEISFAHQNVETYEFEPDCQNVSQAFKKLVALRITQLCIERFKAAQNALSDIQIAEEIEIPIRLVRNLIYELVGAGVLVEIRTESQKSTAYHPGRPLESLTIQGVLDALDKKGITDFPITRTSEFDFLSEQVRKMHDLFINSQDNVLLKEISLNKNLRVPSQ